MELPNFDKHCAHPHCKQLDFLPLRCQCGLEFCSEHFNSHTITCQFQNNVENPTSFENSYKCSFKDCMETSLVPIICPNCHKNFCVKHRHTTQCTELSPEELSLLKEKYAKPVEEFNKAKTEVDKAIEKNLTKQKQKNNATALKVQLMRIKSKAVGSKTIPTGDRIYFNVKYGSEDFPIFISKKWTLGRSIDSIAELLKLQNNNNKATEKKLRLFREQSKELICSDLSKCLESILSDGLIEGETLIIAYVEDDCINLS